jgi:hypothetical protein
MTKFVCISGKAQHGKDTTAGYLREILKADNKRVIIIHYADLLKFICQKYFGWDGQKDATGRRLLQVVGTDVVRAKKPDFWVDFVIEIVKLFSGEWDYVIVPDTRFPNELYRLEDSGFEVRHIEVIRPNFDNGLDETQKKHPSETAMDRINPNYTIYNDGTLDDLRAKVATCAKLLFNQF